MTAVFGFTLKSEDIGFLAADDLESATPSRVDKIAFIGDRFGVAVFGQSSAIDVLHLMMARERVDPAFPSSTDLAVAVLQGLREYAERRYPRFVKQHKRGTVSQERWDKLHHPKATSNLVVLDTQTLDLTHFALGSAFPPDHLASAPQASPGLDGLLHGFGLGTTSSYNGQNVAGNQILLTNPEIFVCWAIHGVSRSHPTDVGQLGAYLFKRGPMRKSVSAFPSRSHAIRAEPDVPDDGAGRCPGPCAGLQKLASYLCR